MSCTYTLKNQVAKKYRLYQNTIFYSQVQFSFTVYYNHTYIKTPHITKSTYLKERDIDYNSTVQIDTILKKSYSKTKNCPYLMEIPLSPFSILHHNRIPISAIKNNPNTIKIKIKNTIQTQPNQLTIKENNKGKGFAACSNYCIIGYVAAKIKQHVSMVIHVAFFLLPHNPLWSKTFPNNKSLIQQSKKIKIYNLNPISNKLNPHL